MTVDVTPWIDRYVAQLQEMGAIRSPAVERAFRRVPRHRLVESFYDYPVPPPGSTPAPLEPFQYVPTIYDPDNPSPEHLDILYADRAIATRVADGRSTSSTSQPALVASMLEQLELSPGLKVLEIGAGTGYNAALMAEIIEDQSRIVSLDIQSDVVEQTRRLLTTAGYPDINILLRDGFEGAPETAPHNRIVATVGCSDLSPHWVEQLHPEGFMLIPLAHGGWHPLVRVWRQDEKVMGRIVGFSGFMRIQGEMATAGPWPHHQNASLAPDMTKAQRLPLWDDFEVEELRRGGGASFGGFYYFLALRDHRTFSSMARPRGYGLHDSEAGSVLISPEEGHILLDGDPSLYEHLSHLYAGWQAVGSPKLTDYAMEFQPLADPAPPVGAGGWTVERQFYRQIVTVPSTT
jgi:protein-L-isoaspartate(D-aspartate) O-methyltransferase